MYVVSISRQSAHSCLKTAVIEPVGSRSVADDLLKLPACTFTIFDPETALTVAFKFTKKLDTRILFIKHILQAFESIQCKVKGASGSFV